MLVEIVEANGKSICRGGSEKCPFKGWHPRRGRAKIAKGAKALQIKIHGAGGSETAFYCAECMKPILETFKEIINNYGA